MASQGSSAVRKVAGTFLAGLVAVLPLVLTVAIVAWLVSFLYEFIGPGSAVGRALESIGLAFIGDKRVAYLIGAVGVLAAIYLLGVFVERGLRKRLEAALTGIVGRVPLVRNVYSTTQKVMSLFEPDTKADVTKMSPVFCTFGGEGGTAVLALLPSPERFTIDGHDYHAVLIPTAPIPFGGALVYVPVEWVRPTDISVEGLLAIYVSMGVASGQHLGRVQDPSLPGGPAAGGLPT